MSKVSRETPHAREKPKAARHDGVVLLSVSGCVNLA